MEIIEQNNKRLEELYQKVSPEKEELLKDFEYLNFIYPNFWGLIQAKKITKKIEEIQKKFNYFEYLKIKCEIAIREVIKAYLNGEELEHEAFDIIGKYMFYSANFYGQEPTDMDLILISRFGSGEFNFDEKDIIYEAFYGLEKDEIKKAR